MSNIADLYADEIKKQFKILYANWEPGGEIRLGDYGVLVGNIFSLRGNLLNDFTEFQNGIIQTREDPKTDLKSFKSENGVETNFKAKAQVGTGCATVVNAGLEIKFSRKNSIFFNAAECRTESILNKAKIGEILIRLLDQDRWKKEYCVVTDLVTAGKTIIAISSSNNASISFEADSPLIEKINLADASLNLNLVSEKSIGYKVDAQNGLNILIGICKIKNKFPWIFGSGVSFETKSLTKSVQYEIENDPGIKTEETTDDLAFSQIGME